MADFGSHVEIQDGCQVKRRKGGVKWRGSAAPPNKGEVGASLAFAEPTFVFTM